MLPRRSMLARALPAPFLGIALLSGIAGAQPAPPSPNDPAPNTGTYPVYWAATALMPTNGEQAVDWAQNMTFGDVPVSRDIKVLYQSDGGLYPYGGIHQVESDPDWMRRHFLKLQHTVNWFIPDPNQSGYGVIDYEEWEACWSLLTNVPSNQAASAHDKDYKDDWRDYIRQYRPELIQGRAANMQEAIFEQTYNEAVQRFFVATINECKRLRPNMKWGYYLFPPRTYYGMLSAEGRSVWAAKHRTALAWLYEVQDAFFPDVYALYYTVHDRQPNTYHQEDPAWQFNEYVRWNITQAEELANGKPVIAFVYLRYHQNAVHYIDQPLNDYNLEKSFTLPKQYGAEGVALWEAIDTSRRFNEDQDYINTKLLPVIRAHCTDTAGNSLALPAQSTTGSSGTGTSSPGTSGGTGQAPSGGSSDQSPSSAGANEDPDDPLRTRPYVSVRPDEEGNSGPSGESSSGGSGDTVNVPHVNPRRGTINVPRNVRNGRSNSRNPSWPAVVQRGVSTTN